MYELVRRKDRGKYAIRWREDGIAKHVSTGCSDEKQAQAFFKAFIEANKQIHIMPVGDILQEHALELKRVMVDKNFTRHLSILRRLEFFDEMSPYDVKENVAAYKKQRRNSPTKPGDNTINRELAVLRAALVWAMDDEDKEPLIPSDVKLFRLKKQKVTRSRYLSSDEASLLLKALMSEPLYLRLSVMLSLLTAQRKSAVLELPVKKVMWNINKIDFRAEHDGKRRKGRSMVTIPDMIKPLLRQACEESKSGFVIEKDGKPVRDIYAEYKALCKSVGLDDVTFHDLRRTWATHAAINGVSMKEISEQLAHHSVVITDEHYLHLSPDNRKQADAFTDGMKLSVLS